MCFAATLLFTGYAGAQGIPTTANLSLDAVETPAGPSFSIVFTDDGTGATEYALEVSPSVGEAAEWFVDTGAVVSPIGGNQFRVTTLRPLDFGAYRLMAYDAAGELTGQFSSPTVELSEGDGELGLLILFSKPFTGTLTYTVGGTAVTQFDPITGTISVVNATTARIPVQLNDDTEINELRFLTLDIENAGGLLGGGNSQALITVLENDAVWNGTILSDGLELAFQYRQTRNNGTYAATLVSDGSGPLPQGEFTAQLGSSSFPATIGGINVVATDSALNVASSMSIFLEVENGVGEDMLSDTEIQGSATVTTTYASMPHLNSERSGRFILLKPAATPSSAEVNLVNSN